VRIQPTERKNNLLFLTGYMGAGKSTIGKKLAKALGYRFVDTDKALEKQYQLGMSEIFAQFGESHFRDEENKLIEKLANATNMVVSAGGGTLCRVDTFYAAQRAGLLVYLMAPVDVLFERVIFSQKDRPMIDQPDAQEKFRERFAKRESYYNKADFKVSTHERPSSEVVEDIVEWHKIQRQAH
jgi:shikimate kinase